MSKKNIYEVKVILRSIKETKREYIKLIKLTNKAYSELKIARDEVSECERNLEEVSRMHEKKIEDEIKAICETLNARAERLKKSANFINMEIKTCRKQADCEYERGRRDKALENSKRADKLTKERDSIDREMIKIFAEIKATKQKTRNIHIDDSELTLAKKKLEEVKVNLENKEKEFNDLRDERNKSKSILDFLQAEHDILTAKK